jgi:hypothetical protein
MKINLFKTLKVDGPGQENDALLKPYNVATDLESDLIESMSGCDLGQINLIPNQYGTFLDLPFLNTDTDITVRWGTCEFSLLKLVHHPKVYI